MRNVLVSILSRLCRHEKGATLVEYGVAIVLALIVGTVALIGLAGQINANLDEATDCLADEANC